MKKLVIVESPAKAKTIGQYLGNDYVVRASYGHVRDLPKSKLGVDVEHGFDVDYVIPTKAKKVVGELKKELKDCQELYLATDMDREGEAIAWHLVKALQPKQPVKRITFHEITKSAITDAVTHPREILQPLVDAQQARRILDRLVGYKLSPFLWKKVYRGLSAGRVQSVAVRLIVEREREIKAFKPREYWTLEVTLKIGNQECQAYVANANSTARLELETQKEAESLAKKITATSLKVEKIETTQSQLRPLPPLITSTLQQHAARVCGFSAKKTMKIAQDLYEGMDIGGKGSIGLITYMRTDSYQLADSAKRQAVELVNKNYGANYLPQSPNQYGKKVRGAQEAHEAIRPTDFTISPDSLKDKLSRDHFRLYSLIWQMALGSQMAPAQIETTTAIITAGLPNNIIARGRRLAFDGFLKLIPDSEERYEALPPVKEGESVTAKKVAPTQHFTEPPGRYSEASLVKELEKLGIGRPSTYAPTMSTIVDRGYVTKQTGRFIPETVADVVTDLLVENFPNIVDYNFTAEMETGLDDIAEGDKEYTAVLKAFYEPFAKILAEKEQTVEKKKLIEEKTDKICPECGKPIIIKLGRFGKFYACTGYPECKHTEPIIVKAEVQCPNCGKDMVRKGTRKGKVFWGCSGYPACKTAFWDEPVNKKCPTCSNLLLKKGTSLVCSARCGYKEAIEEKAEATPVAAT